MNFTLFQHYLGYYWRAQTKYRIHSPFVFDWINKVLEDDRDFYAFSRIEALRAGLLQTQTKLEIEDLGAGSLVLKNTNRSVADITKHSVSAAAKCRFLFRNVLYFQPSYKIELGTCLGISTLYQYFPNTQAMFYTLEGSAALLELAEGHFKKLGATAINSVLGNFEDTLAPTLQKMGRVDYAYIDGNHRGEATLRYFEAILPYCHPHTVLVFDDIYWSRDMQQAWQQIKKHPKVRLTLDVFKVGLVFFREEQKEVQHFTLIPTRYKPFQMGFFK